MKTKIEIINARTSAKYDFSTMSQKDQTATINALKTARPDYRGFVIIDLDVGCGLCLVRELDEETEAYEAAVRKQLGY